MLVQIQSWTQQYRKLPSYLARQFSVERKLFCFRTAVSGGDMFLLFIMQKQWSRVCMLLANAISLEM
jgi:hypothetical protein